MSLGEQQQQQRHASEEPSEPNLNPSPAGPTSSTKSKGGSSSPTLADMLAAGLLQAGHDNVTVTYRGVSYSASLQDNGAIAFRGALGGRDAQRTAAVECSMSLGTDSVIVMNAQQAAAFPYVALLSSCRVGSWHVAVLTGCLSCHFTIQLLPASISRWVTVTVSTSS